ncbi:3'(2'),5'-bisphosphate nucleotidase CysQ [Corallococcus sp. H22C18031201]|uniref:3'(2'),5'-bisphosphate nucleotidase CysQ family protein n=1 Tax=Citreicoccus inhibens TaxID=2849499 RepID=UPI000E76DD6F|nr:3'(2'),5'-bisphosphate nucleotidase CysQ [Citreicoccus inhibens]MBU8895064.1 3'(2'),5'-bisphosphate nucleotidase CysQ [Citreicoccus inhibens]RJS27213.1 3'(2'),5'-bisphosphate nucleotidase CysQ [Corallococcus sp. H22C18031201]
MSILDRELEVARRIARQAGEILQQVYATDFSVQAKEGGAGPVTVADERANAFIVGELRKAFPGDGVVAEESEDASDAKRFDRCWYVDPLDGTQEFVKRNGEFAIHIGLAVAGKAAVGVVYRPVGDTLFAGVVGQQGFVEDAGGRRALRVSDVAEPSEMRLVVSRSHRSALTDQIVQRLGITREKESGSVGLKCGLLAEAHADLYIHVSGKSYRWDNCAPEAVLRSAGGILTDLGGVAYRYDGSELQNHRGLLACNAAAFPRVQPVVEQFAREAGILK